MDAPPGRTPLALEPLDPPAGGGGSPRTSPVPSPASERLQDLRITSSDDCLARAASEYQAGHVDQPLWDRSVAQTGDDEALAVAAYLRARATALRLKMRDERAEKRIASGALQRASDIAPPPHDETKPATVAQVKRPTGGRSVAYAAGAFAVALVAGGAWLAVSTGENPPVSPPVAAASPMTRASTAPPAASAVSVQPAPDLSLQTKVQQLKAAGNWNVLVLFASEWTRKEPTNALAWTELSRGYTRLRQWNDALESATNAVNLAPQDASSWRNLGHVNLALERFPEARIAYEQALTVDPDHPEALCGATTVAKRQGRGKDADSLAARLKSAAGSCVDGVDVALVAGAAPARPNVPSGTR